MRLSVRAKLLVGFAIVIALSGVGGVLSIGHMSTLSDLTEKMYSNNFVAMSRLSDARIAATRHALLTSQIARTTDPARREQLTAQRRELEEEFLAALEAVESVYSTPRGQELIDQVRLAAEAYKSASDEQIAAGSADASRLQELSQTSQRRLDEFDARMDQLVSLGNQLAANDAVQARVIFQDVTGVTLLLLAILMAIGFGVTFWLSRSIGVGMRIAAAAASRVAQGDLTQPVPVSSRDEIGELGVSINEMMRNLNLVAIETREIVQNLASAASEILAAMTQQGASTTEQAAAVDQTTAIVGEVRVSAQQTTQKAQSVAAAARRAYEVGEEGLRVVELSISGMQQVRSRVESIAGQILFLAEQTQQIGEIITMVDEIADQSNLLAVNAAIEASRAGEHGRGFAVVAQEVRRLAERSKAATVQVRTILTEIQRATNAAVLATEQGTKGADEGVKLVEQAGQAIAQLISSVRLAAEAAQQIQAAIGQQSAGMDQIASAMASINRSASETATSTRQLQRAAEDINAMAQRLTAMMGRYKLQHLPREGERDDGRTPTDRDPVYLTGRADEMPPGAGAWRPRS